MKLISEIKDEDIGFKAKKTKLKERTAARAVLLNKNKVALLHVSKHGYHKLPGGGLEGSETVKQALVREILEETGCKIKIIADIGKIVEYRTYENTLQTSFCFLSEVVSEGKPDFDQGEIDNGFGLEWVDIKSAIKLLEKEKPETYDGKFIVIRDRMFLKKAEIIVKSGN
ncbi:MAG: NUDIX domain-containing protein [Candidatus Aenigmarchaeota archaeon]|nr:NUDIX domain-containing protein [Candidatus Aenigmarchaeota archaeon]